MKLNYRIEDDNGQLHLAFNPKVDLMRLALDATAKGDNAKALEIMAKVRAQMITELLDKQK